ncbi:GNAT family N-acetyltransferase [Jeotgalibacillus proteolyticus]|nr:GNAT family N-acetyltransferase [Jeotgalibacillus proteolyticus]
MKEIAEMVLAVQLPAYRVEAAIIGFYDIPPLKDTATTLQQCRETFYGYFLNEELCGVISLKLENEIIDIHRLIVHPNHFKKGIAQKLLTFIENEYKTKPLKVSTASKNLPAIRFYEKNGFQKCKELTLSEELSLTFFEKREQTV